MASPDATLNEHICRVAETGPEQLEACGLPIRAPLVILAVPEIAHGDVSCLGAYDCDRLELRLVTPAALDAALAPDSVLRDIPREALFDSLVVHELAHAALAQQPCAAPPCLAEHEYVAYAMQMQALAPEHRAIVTDAARGLDRVTEERLNEFIAVAAPDTFAAWAWTHFSRPGERLRLRCAAHLRSGATRPRCLLNAPSQGAIRMRSATRRPSRMFT